ncbi:MAG: hypothetical protein ABIG28_00175 [archaeon]
MAYNSITDVLMQLEGLGLFEFILPFLLIFAVVYGVLSWMNIFGENKGVHIIISLVIGMLAIRLPFFSAFLSEMAPRLGVGLSIILGVLILVGMFTPKNKRGTIAWILFAIGAVIFIIILVQTSNVMSYWGYGTGFFSEQLIGWIVMLAILIGVIVAVAVGNSSGSASEAPAGLWVKSSGKDD